MTTLARAINNLATAVLELLVGECVARKSSSKMARNEFNSGHVTGVSLATGMLVAGWRGGGETWYPDYRLLQGENGQVTVGLQVCV
jgi:hypothetical protein